NFFGAFRAGLLNGVRLASAESDFDLYKAHEITTPAKAECFYKYFGMCESSVHSENTAGYRPYSAPFFNQLVRSPFLRGDISSMTRRDFYGPHALKDEGKVKLSSDAPLLRTLPACAYAGGALWLDICAQN